MGYSEECLRSACGDCDTTTLTIDVSVTTQTLHAFHCYFYGSLSAVQYRSSTVLMTNMRDRQTLKWHTTYPTTDVTQITRPCHRIHIRSACTDLCVHVSNLSFTGTFSLRFQQLSC